MNNLAAQAVIQCQARAYAIRDGQSGTRAGFSPNTSVYHSTNAVFSCTHHRRCIILPTDGVVNDTLNN